VTEDLRASISDKGYSIAFALSCTPRISNRQWGLSSVAVGALLTGKLHRGRVYAAMGVRRGEEDVPSIVGLGMNGVD
jgi:hypothetical protein